MDQCSPDTTSHLRPYAENKSPLDSPPKFTPRPAASQAGDAANRNFRSRTDRCAKRRTGLA